MKQIVLFSFLLLFGIVISQLFDLVSIRDIVNTVTMICLAYIMLYVGLEFDIDKGKLKSYGTDYLVAMTAATFPWFFCAIYFFMNFDVDIKESLLLGRFAAPTSAGVLFAMLTAAGLAATWLFKKVRILAIFDDLDTVLLMVPLQIMIVGMKGEMMLMIMLILLLLLGAYVFLHQIKLPVSPKYFLVYSVGLVFLCEWLEHTTNVHLEVLLPAFALGCMIRHKPSVSVHFVHSKFDLDLFIKSAFMFFVGCSLPKIAIPSEGILFLVINVLLITIISNIGKCFPVFFYKKEASFRERIALCFSMFPRGEVGAGVLLVSISYGITGLPAAIAGLSLALNLVLTGFFIAIVFRLIGHERSSL